MVVGAGPVGLRAVEALLRLDPGLPIVLFGAEPWAPYNRIKLTALLAREDGLESLCTPLPRQANLRTYFHRPVLGIDREQRRVHAAQGLTVPYRRVVLATGSQPHLPEIPGITLPQVYTFRDLGDAERLGARQLRSRRTVVLGGGLLGLEAAWAMQRFRTRVTVIEHSAHLLFRLLDERAAALAQEALEARDIEVLLRERVCRVLGDGRVEGVELHDGRRLPCDTMVVAAGIRPNTDLAKRAGLKIGRGIWVNDAMQSSDPAIYAVGECAEHRDTLYGLVTPGFEQATVAARNIAGGRARYLGSINTARLKVPGCQVMSFGETRASRRALQEVCYREGKIYRKLFLAGGRLHGAIAVGAWESLGRVQEAVIHRRRIWPWQLWRFRRSGLPWPPAHAETTADWPAQTVICNCTGVTRGQLTHALVSGCRTLVELSQRTGAATVCGSCRPLLAELTNSETPAEPLRGHRTLLAICLLALASVPLFAGLPAVPYNRSVQIGWEWGELWRNSLAKQLSGYTLLGLSALTAILSLRKRVTWAALGEFRLWRMVHGAVGMLAVLVLVVHTGMRLGEHLNRYLMVTFLALTVLGAIAGVVIGLEHRWARSSGRRLRSVALWLHIVLVWPVPTLLAYHILKTYYF